MKIRNVSRRRVFLLAGAIAVSAALSVPALADGRTLFVGSAVENGNGTATLPLYRGTSHGRTVYYVILDSSDGNDADALGVNKSSKLANARGTAAVQRAAIVNGTIDFPASVDFSANRVVSPGPTGFPPAAAEPGSVGEPGYSPLIQLPNGIVRNAPQVANDSGSHDKVVSIDTVNMRVTLRETDGVANGRAVKYISTDSSDPGAAALEGSTYAPALNAAPFVGIDGTGSARTSLAAFVNGQTGAANPQRQGLNSALLDGLDPLNVLRWTPNQGRYSPLWDVHPAQWSAAAVAAGQNVRQWSWGDVSELADKGAITGPGGAAFGPAGFIVNCPIVSSD
ncbi:MAG: hypothetical protein ACM3SO_05580 [Betaproteobacteria bacterium]